MAERYGRERTGGSFPIYSSVHRDTKEALDAFRQRHGLTNSGAIHHLLRLQLGLPPLRNLSPEP